jgi:hypothetical protein
MNTLFLTLFFLINNFFQKKFNHKGNKLFLIKKRFSRKLTRENTNLKKKRLNSHAIIYIYNVKWFFPRGWERTSALSSKFVSKYLTSPPNKASRSRTPTLACMLLYS